MNLFKNKSGFTVFEIIVSLSLFVIIIVLTASIYDISQRTHRKGSIKGELSQNARVAMDRISREIRQSVEVVTIMPATSTDSIDPPVDEIFFQDGHDPDKISYLRYYLDGNDLKRSVIVYSFASDPTIYVYFNTLDESSNPADEHILEDRVVGEYFSSLKFWGENDLVNIEMFLTKGQEDLQIKTKVFSRN